MDSCGPGCKRWRPASASVSRPYGIFRVSPLRPGSFASAMPATDNFDIILRRFEEIGARLTEGVAGAEYASLSRELAELDPVVAAIKAWRAKEQERTDLDLMLEDAGLDQEIRDMARAERERAAEDSEAMAQQIRIALL